MSAQHTPAAARRRYLKNAVKARVAPKRDRLAEGASPRWRAAFMLGSLQACAQRAGWSARRIEDAIYPMAERIPGCVLYGRHVAKATGSAA